MTPIDEIRKLLPKLTDAERAALYDQLGTKLDAQHKGRGGHGLQQTV
jgi:hypothetical protein